MRADVDASMRSVIDKIDYQKRQAPHTLNAAPSLTVLKPFEIDEIERIQELTPESAAAECYKLCNQGTDPDEIAACMQFCERLLFSTLELHKYPQSARYPVSHEPVSMMF